MPLDDVVIHGERNPDLPSRRRRRRRRRFAVPPSTRPYLPGGHGASSAAEILQRDQARRRQITRQTVGYRTSDAGEAAAFTRSPTFAETRRAADIALQRTLSELLISGKLSDEEAARWGERTRQIQSSDVSPFGGLNAFDRAMKDLMEAVIYTPAGVYEAGKAVTLDARDFVTSGDVTPERTAGLGEQVARQTYEDLRHPLRHPGFTALDVFALGSLGAGGASRVSAASRAARAATGPARLSEALFRAPAEGGSLLRRPAPGRAEIAPGVSVNLSPNPLAALFQRRRLRQHAERPESRFAGDLPGRNLHERVGFERRRQEQILADIDRAEAEGLRARGRKLDDVTERAIQIVGEGVPIAERIALHERDLAAASGSDLRVGAQRRRLEAEIDLLRRVSDSGLVEGLDGRPVPSARLRELYERSVASTGRREAILEELGLAGEDQLTARRAAPARVFAGAEFERRPAVAARSEQVRVYPREDARVTTTGSFPAFRYAVEGDQFQRRLPARKAEAAIAHLVGGEEIPAGELFVSYRRARRRFGRAQLGTSQGIGIPRQNLLGGRFTGEAIHQGRVPGDVVERVVEGELEAQRHRTVLRLREQAVAESIGADELLALPASEQKHYRPVRIAGKPYSAETKTFLDSLQGKIDEGRPLTNEERAAFAERTEVARSYFFPSARELDRDSALAAAELNEVRFFDARRFGGLERPQAPITGLGKSFQRVFDEVNSARDITDLMLRLGYGPANLASQIALTISAGVGPRDLALAIRMARHLGPEERAKVRAARGGGFAEAGLGPRTRGRLKTLRNWLANKWGIVLDDPWRMLMFARYARQLGYTSPSKIARLLEPKNVDDLLEVAKRTRDAGLDYDRLGPFERNTLSRAIRFYPFLKASSVFTGKWARDNPVQAAVVMQLALVAKEDAEEEIGPVPFYRRGIFAVGEDDEGRPLVVDPRAAQLFDAPVQAAQIAEGLVTGIGAELGLADPEEAAALREQIVPGDLVSPAVRLGLDALDPRDRFTGEELTFGEAFTRNQLQVPQVRLAQAFLDPEEGDQSDRQLPTSRETELGRYLGGGLFPRPANRGALSEVAAEEGRALLSPEERREADAEERIAEARRTVRAAGQELPAEYAKLVRRRALYDDAKEAMEDDLEVERLTISQRVLALIAVANHTPEVAGYHDEYLSLWREARGNPLDEGDRPNGPMNKLYEGLRRVLFGRLDEIEEWLERLRDLERIGPGA